MRLFSFIAIFLGVLSACAQQNKVIEIREYHNKIKGIINNKNFDSKADSLGNLKINCKTFVQRQRDTLFFWYFDFEKNNITYTDSVNSMAYVIHKVDNGDLITYNEYLFFNGKMIYFFDKMKNTGLDLFWEYRYYFSNEKLIRFMDGGEILSYDADPKIILRQGESLQKQFISLF